MQPDLVVSKPNSPQTWNRYSYVVNNPIRFADPTGHACHDNDYSGHIVTVCDSSPVTTPIITPTNNQGGGNQCTGLSGHALDSCMHNGHGNDNHGDHNGGNSIFPTDAIITGLASVGYSAQVAIAASQINTVPYYGYSGNNILIYGPRSARTVLGFNPYTNIIGATNPALFDPIEMAGSGVNSIWTRAGIAVSVGLDVKDYLEGKIDGPHFAAATSVDIASAVVTAAVAGAFAGAVAGGVVGLGFGAVPGALIGAAAGIGTAVTAAYLFQASGAKASIVNGLADNYFANDYRFNP